MRPCGAVSGETVSAVGQGLLPGDAVLSMEAGCAGSQEGSRVDVAEMGLTPGTVPEPPDPCGQSTLPWKASVYSSEMGLMASASKDGCKDIMK